MGTFDKRIDQYILNSADFAQPVLIHLRQLIHDACPDVEEKYKWSSPHFDFNGGPMAHMASFKRHCAFGFWKAALMEDPDKFLLTGSEKTAMGHLGRIASMKDLPSDEILIRFIKQAMKLNENGIKIQKQPATLPKELSVPDYFMKALKSNKMAHKTFENFSPSNKKEYVEWVTGAKSESTRDKRLETAIEWMEQGKIRHWKYIK